MPEILGRLRTPRLATAPSSPQAGEMYYDTAQSKLLWWNGSAWIASGQGPPGPAGAVDVKAQDTPPVAPAVGALWIETDATPVYGPKWLQVTQAQYDALTPKDPETMYVVIG